MNTPSDRYQRMSINIELNARLGVRIWSFPMRYLPVTMKDRSHVGKSWNRYYLRSFQIMLQATHGVVSGSNEFFHRAFGNTFEDFERLLALPHAFIFERNFFEHGGGRPLLDEYETLINRLSPNQRNELIAAHGYRRPPRLDLLHNSTRSSPPHSTPRARRHTRPSIQSTFAMIAQTLPPGSAFRTH